MRWCSFFRKRRDGVRTPSHGNVFLTERYNEVPGKLRYNTLELVEEEGKPRFHLALCETDWPKGLDWTNGLKRAERAEEE